MKFHVFEAILKRIDKKSYRELEEEFSKVSGITCPGLDVPTKKLCMSYEPTHYQKGEIVHKIVEGEDIWGIKLIFWSRPFEANILRIKELPLEFQREGMKVKCEYTIADVIGNSDWDVIIEIKNIETVTSLF